VGVCVEVWVELSDGVVVGVPVFDAVEDGVIVPVSDGVCVGVAEGVDNKGVPDKLAEGTLLALIVVDGVCIGVGEGLGLTEGKASLSLALHAAH